MQRHIRHAAPCHAYNAGVIYDEGIRTGALQLLQQARKLIKVLIVGKRIAGHIYLATVGMSIVAALFKLLHGKIIREVSQAHALSPNVYRVCAVVYGGDQPLHIARRGKQFGKLNIHQLF